jgi:broad specificity phosphatase PhoE
MNTTNYFEKYLKYKNKYLELKKLTGGNPNTKNIILVGTHGFRIKCLFATLIHLTKLQNFKLQSFKNCAVIRCYSDNTHIRFEIIYNGNRSDAKEKEDGFLYYQDNNKDIIKQISLLKSQFPKFDIPINTEIFLIRHGEGIHNVLKVATHKSHPNKLLDAKLNHEGHEQAEIAGNIFKNYLKQRLSNDLIRYNINLLFCASDLDRTRETIIYFMKSLQDYNQSKKYNIKYNNVIHILPCIHEVYPSEIKGDVILSSINNPLKDVTVANNMFCEKDKYATESYANQSSCLTIQQRQTNNICQSIKINNFGPVMLDWSFYNKTRNMCPQTNLFEQIKEFINKNNIPQQRFNRGIDRSK